MIALLLSKNVHPTLAVPVGAVLDLIIAVFITEFLRGIISYFEAV